MKLPIKLSERPAILRELKDNSVVIVDPGTVWITSDRLPIGKGTVILPNTYIFDDTENSSIGENCEIGPNAFLRGWFTIGNRVKIGFGAEIVRSSINDGSKAPHFCHIGDVTGGKGCNFAAGTIVCNYDGEKKNTTIIEDDVFIGSGTMLIPSAKRGLRLGKCCFIGALSRINKDIPPGALVVMKDGEQYIKRDKRIIKEDGNWKTVSSAEYYADFMNGRQSPDGV